jgi:hypothetical protein
MNLPTPFVRLEELLAGGAAVTADQDAKIREHRFFFWRFGGFFQSLRALARIRLGPLGWIRYPGEFRCINRQEPR